MFGFLPDSPHPPAPSPLRGEGEFPSSVPPLHDNPLYAPTFSMNGAKISVSVLLCLDDSSAPSTVRRMMSYQRQLRPYWWSSSLPNPRWTLNSQLHMHNNDAHGSPAFNSRRGRRGVRLPLQKRDVSSISRLNC